MQELYSDFCGDVEESEELLMVSLRGWSLCTSQQPVIRSTLWLGRLELTSFKHRIEKARFGEEGLEIGPGRGVLVYFHRF